jgi:hypothetical protein
MKWVRCWEGAVARASQDAHGIILVLAERKVKIAKVGADRWTDNVYTLRSWVIQKRGCAGGEADKWLGIKDDFDYVE